MERTKGKNKATTVRNNWSNSNDLESIQQEKKKESEHKSWPQSSFG